MGTPETVRLADSYPHLGTGPIPIEPYISEAYFEQEREKIFRRVWLNVGRVNYIPAPGDYMVKNLAVLGGSVLIVHGDDGRIRAFHNVCQHRGNQLVYDESGCRKAFTCGFHQWVFDTRGRLRHVADEEQFFGITKNDYNLPEFACDTWNGFIFIHSQTKPAQGLREYLGPMADDLQDYPFGEMERVGAWRATVNCNWKVHMDAFQESYHVVGVHSRSLADAFNNTGKANSLAGHARLYANHRGLSLPANPNYSPKPAEALAFRAASTVMQGAGAGSKPPKGVNHGGIENWGFDANVIFPNMVISAANGWCLVQTYMPEAVDRTYWEINLHMPRATSLAATVAQSYSANLIRDVLMMEDATTLERTFHGLKSGGIRHFLFSDQEIACRHQFEVVDAMVNTTAKSA